MHPTLIMAVVDEVARERRSESERSRPRFPSPTNAGSPATRFRGLTAVRELGRRFHVASRMRARVS